MSDIEVQGIHTYLCTEVDIKKSYNESGEGKRYIFGYASTPHVDEDGDIILQKYIDITPFVDRGYFNYEHRLDPEFTIGYPYPDECRIDDQGLFVAGELFPPGISPVADQVWNLIVNIKKNNIPRKLYFSVEGKAYRYHSDPPGIIRGFKVYEVAITRRPANPHAVLNAMLKSVQVGGDSALYVVNPHEMTSGISALRREIVDDTLRVVTYLLKNYDELLGELRKKDKLTKEEAVLYALLMSCPKLQAILEAYGGAQS